MEVLKLAQEWRMVIFIQSNMKKRIYNYCYLVLVLTFTSLKCQGSTSLVSSSDSLKIDSVLIDETQSRIPNPFKAKVDSIKYNQYKDVDSNALVVDLIPECKIYILDNGDSMSIKNYCKKNYSNIKLRSIFYCEIDWSGRIRKVVLKKTSDASLYNQIDFKTIWSKVKSTPPMLIEGVPTDTRVIVPFVFGDTK